VDPFIIFLNIGSELEILIEEKKVCLEGTMVAAAIGVVVLIILIVVLLRVL
jgi:hypothetical protein